MPRSDETAAAPMLRRFTVLCDYTIGASDGDIGSVDDLYVDDLSWTVRYAVVDTGTWLAGRKVLLSPAVLRGVDPVGMRIRTELTRRQVEESPVRDTDKPVSRQHETALSAYYGYQPYWGGPFRWGLHAYPYPLLHAGGLPPSTATPHANRVAEELAARERENQDEHLRSARAVTGHSIRATDGELGHVEDFLVDEQDWAVRYLIVDPRSWWPGPHVLVAIDWVGRVSWSDAVVEVDVSRETVRNAPVYDPAGTFEREQEARLYAYHRRPAYWDQDPDTWKRYPPAA